MNLQSQHIGLPTSKEQLHFFFVNPPASLVKIKSIGIKTATMDSDIVYEVYNYMLLYQYIHNYFKDVVFPMPDDNFITNVHP